MKTNLIFLVLLIGCISCGTNNKPLSDAQKEKIKGEVKEVVNTIIKGCEEANFDMAMTPWLDSPDFIYVYNGVSLNYKGVVEGMKPMFSTMINQKVTIIDEKYAFLDDSTIIYTTNCKFLENYKDGHAILSDPMVWQITFRKINNKWMAINGVESSVRQNAKNIETSIELNQIELHKQFVGNWKTETVKDTTIFWNVKSYGTGYEGYFKIETKGKIAIEGKQLWGYDKNLDKYIWSEMFKGMDNVFYTSWFTSKNKCTMLYFGDISNPDNATTKWDIEFKSPDMFIQNMIMNNKIVKVDKCTRVK
jgi:hypothetical protein